MLSSAHGSKFLLGGRRWSVPKVFLDVTLWVGLAVLAEAVHTAWFTALTIFAIGAFPLHDILVHGHEATHGLVARRRWLNDFFLWWIHALVFVSGSAYRAFHLEHHRRTHRKDDPEVEFLSKVFGHPTGWAFLLIPVVSQISVTLWPLRRPSRQANGWSVAQDVVGAAVLHGILAWCVGWELWLVYCVAPVFTGLAFVVVLRSLCEHHHTVPGSRWTHARAMETHPLIQWLWSNVNHHLEHHLMPSVPWHRLPQLRQQLRPLYEHHGSPVNRGYLKAGLRLLQERRHYADGKQAEGQPPAVHAEGTARSLVDQRSAAFRLKVLWFQDILRSRRARQHLWSLYYAGEAYEELHADDVYVDKLPGKWGKLLARHLRDETRHAGVFRTVLSAEGAEPQPVRPEEDLGYYALTHVIPEVVEVARQPRVFTDGEAMRYFAFLHALELRSIGDLCALRAAAAALGHQGIVNHLSDILADEVFHATYTHRGVYSLAPNPKTAHLTLLTIHRRERQAYRQVVSGMLRRFEQLDAVPTTLAGQLRWMLMKLAALTGVAFPRLPAYRAMPKRLLWGNG